MDQAGAMDAAVIGMAATVRHGAQWYVIAVVVAACAAIAAVTAITFIAPNHRVGDKEI
jgi:hypothetical protein